MKAIQLQRHARPDEACICVELEEPGEPDADEVLVEVQASAINPADLLIFEGRYPGPAELPAAVGIEGAGQVLAVGSEVAGLAPGDKVLSLERANWAERIRVKAGRVIKLPSALDIRDAAMLKANPPSAHLMLTSYVDLEPGDWVIQNAANSAVGRHVIRLAKARDLRSANVVRRESLIDELKAIGADCVLLEGDDLATRLRAEIGEEAPVRLGIDAVGGDACLHLAEAVSKGATLVNYGFLSGEPCKITPHHLIVHGLTLKGFWLMQVMGSSTRAEIEALYAEMAQHFIDGTLEVLIEATYELPEISQALAHAYRESRDGKILLTPSGRLA